MTDELLNHARIAYRQSDCSGLFRGLENDFSVSKIRPVTRRAAVLVPIFPNPSSSLFPSIARNTCEYHARPLVWLTRRSQNVRQGGDICLPGGIEEDGDESLVSTAIREAGEEMGILPDQIEIVGPLPSLTVMRGDRRGNIFTSITPVLGIVSDEGFQPTLNPDEVASAFHLPLHRFLESESHSTRPWTLSVGGEELSMQEHCFEDDVSSQNRGETIVNTWGFTARVLISCACLLFDGRPEFDMAEMGDQRGPFDYYNDWLHYAENKFQSSNSKL